MGFWGSIDLSSGIEDARKIPGILVIFTDFGGTCLCFVTIADFGPLRTGGYSVANFRGAALGNFLASMVQFCQSHFLNIVVK
ncbi:MAG: hypothetical protein JRI87_09440 [Deltaproteobacteria bacterium]|nr:hypothetical protein [Deltaproteobacteria bacterium]